MKKLILVFILAVFANCDAISIKNFEVDVYSKTAQNSTKKIRLDLEVIGDDVSTNEPYVFDALNVIVGSFYAEDLLTSMGKEKFKDAFIKYAAKKHNISLDNVLILALKVVENAAIEDIIEAIRNKNLCGQVVPTPNYAPKKQKSNDVVVSPELNEVNQSPIDLNSIDTFGDEFGKDFGEK
ncbi:MAG: hypothetical protein K5978_07865 [Campylobacter sp.]|nr:hypothetical protein [Campylobacter sp.]